MKQDKTVILYHERNGELNNTKKEIITRILETINNHVLENDIAVMNALTVEYWQGRLFESIDLQKDVHRILDEYI